MYRFTVSGPNLGGISVSVGKCRVCGKLVTEKNCSENQNKPWGPFTLHKKCEDSGLVNIGFKFRDGCVTGGVICFRHPGKMMKSRTYPKWVMGVTVDTLPVLVRVLHNSRSS